MDYPILNNLSIRLATLDDTERIFLWSNDSLTRQASFHSEPIIWKNHQARFKEKLQSDKSKIFIIENNHKPIAFVRFDKNEETIIGITIAPEFRGKHLAAHCILAACNAYRMLNNDIILAYIKMDNIASQKAFIKAGFKLTKETIINNHPCYQLTY